MQRYKLDLLQSDSTCVTQVGCLPYASSVNIPLTFVLKNILYLWSGMIVYSLIPKD